jgi:hypothetical protein
MHRICNIYVGMKMDAQFYLENLKIRNILGDLYVDEVIILK